MKVKVLGASGSEAPGHRCPAFLVDGLLLLDAGTIGVALNIHEENGIRRILLTHTHFDHIKGIPFLLDNLVIRGTGNTVTVTGAREVLADLKENIFNGRIWPDFSRLPAKDRPALRYQAIPPSRPVPIDGYTVLMVKVRHSVPAYGYVVKDERGAAIAYTGDTGPTDGFWEAASAHGAKCLIVETSFPNRLEKVALATGHLTPSLLAKEIAKMSRTPDRICAMHLKPQYIDEIAHEVETSGLENIEILTEGELIVV